VTVGMPTGLLTVTNSIKLEGAVVTSLNTTNTPNCGQLSSPTITLGATATLVITNVGSPLTNAYTFQLFNQAVNTNIVSITLPALTVDYYWTNRLAVDGSIAVVPYRTVPPTPPGITNSFDVSSGKLTLSWGDDYRGFYRLLSQTNTTAVGLTTTGWAEWAGSKDTNKVIVTIDATKGTVFFRLVYP
jgi:hypothetical protein